MTENTSTSFADLALAPELCHALSGLGYEEPTPIQEEAIPPLLKGNDLVGQAATGTGKTAAFALPVLQRVLADAADQDPRDQSKSPTALVLTPTRELAVQVSEAMQSYAQDMGARIVPVYGGQPIGRQLSALRRGADVVVGTPGRVQDHINRGTLDFADLKMAVLDEADEMLDMGFAEEIEAILDTTPDTRQTALFSATMPPRISGMVRRYLNDPVRVELGRKTELDPENGKLVRQCVYVVPRGYKPAALGRILDMETPQAAVVFCRTRDEVDQVTETLNGRGHRAEALHGGMDQNQRDRVMGRLRAGTMNLLVATDVAARGLDIDQLTHVVNYDVPNAPESYVHRIGRVGRAGRAGTALTLAEPREQRLLKAIERATGVPLTVEKLPSVADLRAKRLELTHDALREILLKDSDLEDFEPVVRSLSEEFGQFETALAAVKFAREAKGAVRDADEIPSAELPKDRGGRDRRQPGGRDDGPGGRGPRRARGATAGMTRLFVGTGRSAGIRPQDLVGAIAGESRLSGRDIGHIEITNRFSLVEVPESAADDVVQALRHTSIKGRKATVRRERFEAN